MRRRSASHRLCPISDVTSFLATCDNGFCHCDSARSPGDIPRARSHTHADCSEINMTPQTREWSKVNNHTPNSTLQKKKKTIPTSDWITVISYAQTKSISLPLSHRSFLERPLSLSFFESPWQTWVRRLGKVAQGQTCCLLLWRTTACGELRILPPAEANLLLKDTRKREGARAQLVVIFES